MTALNEPVVEPEPPMHASDRVTVHLATLERAVFLTQLADAKAAPLIALHGAIAGATIAGLDRYLRLLDRDVHSPFAVLLAGTLLAVYTLSAITVAVLTLAVYYPVVRPSGRSLTFFADIRGMEASEFAASSRMQTFEQLEEDLLGQVHAVSHIVAEKFDQLRWGFLLSGLGLAVWIPLTIWAST